MNDKGNQKHLTFEQRVDIDKGFTEKKGLTEIARMIARIRPLSLKKSDYTRIQRNVLMQDTLIHRKKCKIVYLCEEQCGTLYKICKKPDMRCINVCPVYETAECKKLDKPLYVCNGCTKKTYCLMPRKFYSSKYAHDE